MSINHVQLQPINTYIGTVVSDQYEPVLAEPTVTQLTSISTPVTLDAEWGYITTYDGILAVGAAFHWTFRLNNSFIAANSVVKVTVVPGTAIDGGVSLMNYSIISQGVGFITIRLMNLGTTAWQNGSFRVGFIVNN